MQFPIIDGHAHCGVQDRQTPQAFEHYLARTRGSGIAGAVLIPPVYEIYDRYDPDFQDNDYWRQRRHSANEYLPTLGNAEFTVFPFFFIWNDFAVDRITPRHFGIKWHRHSDEPRYHYDDPACAKAIEEIGRRNLPVCLEEELQFTMRFIDDLAPGLRVIIPHCGYLNGGYDALIRLGVWERPNIFTDTSLVPPSTVLHYVKNFGTSRIMFGSDFPFGDPRRELAKILQLGLPKETEEALVSINVRRLLTSGIEPHGE